ncbi:cyanocobalamin reductase / alkylcobalamin dealkylase isoform X3 [Zonotrichia albicollis]|uniref:cyanocobalamin reductase / alkylcobalamin dealkylase isoform X3 n=1 Tax=Zonotrichia albicollis TaxID=44394 RepID=UPI003D80B475
MERRVAEQLRSALGPLGLEAHALKVGWYNAVLQPAFHLPYPDDTLAFVVLSTPSMFDKALKPFVSKERLKIIRDPVDQCVSHHLSRVKEKFPDQRVDIMFDYELLPSRKPKFLAQTAAHVAGAAYYYQRKDVKLDPWGKKLSKRRLGEREASDGYFELLALITHKVRQPGFFFFFCSRRSLAFVSIPSTVAGLLSGLCWSSQLSRCRSWSSPRLWTV